MADPGSCIAVRLEIIADAWPGSLSIDRDVIGNLEPGGCQRLSYIRRAAMAADIVPRHVQNDADRRKRGQPQLRCVRTARRLWVRGRCLLRCLRLRRLRLRGRRLLRHLRLRRLRLRRRCLLRCLRLRRLRLRGRCLLRRLRVRRLRLRGRRLLRLRLRRLRLRGRRARFRLRASGAACSAPDFGASGCAAAACSAASGFSASGCAVAASACCTAAASSSVFKTRETTSGR